MQRYKTMKRISVIVAMFLMPAALLPSAAPAADIVYPGAPLAPSPFGPIDSLFPGDSLSGNTVAVTGGLIGGDVYGGVTNSASDVSGNTVTITGNPAFGALYGGRGAGGLVSGNSVVISSGDLSGAVTGGGATTGSVTNNSVAIFGGHIANLVTGGRNSGAGQVAFNEVLVQGGTVDGVVIGGASGTGPVQNNRVRLLGGTVNNEAGGGRTVGSGLVSDNYLLVDGAVVNGQIFGGFAAVSGDALNNAVDFRSGAVTGNVTGGRVFLTGTSARNLASISGGNVTGSVYGGFSGEGSAVNNTAELMSGTVSADFYGGYSVNGAATGNASEISGGSVTGKTYGGYSDGAAGATGNRVAVSGGLFGSDIHGGYSASGPATGNAVVLRETPDVSASTIYGGLSPGGGNARTGNVLTVIRFSGPAKGILNFETYDFFAPALGSGETQIRITGGTPTDMSATTVNLLGMAGGDPFLQPGDSIVLIDKVTGVPASANGEKVPKGAALLYDFDISTADGTLRATLRGRDVNPDVNILPHGRAAATAFMSHYADLLADLASEKLLEPREKRAGPAVYAVTTGGKYRYTADASTDVKGVSFITGLDWRLPTEPVNTVLGVFFEGGFGDYEASYGKGRFGTIKGEGDVDYYGAGVLCFAGLPSGPYAEASLRGGRVRTDFSSAYTRNFLGRDTDYETSYAYYGAHGGLGWLWRPGEGFALNVYGKYLWLRQAADDAAILGDRVHFKAVDSQRVRAGARFSRTLENGFAPYAGAGYEYEFDSEVRVNVLEDVTLSAGSLKGGTVIGELGGVYRYPGGLFLEIGVKGFEGMREGVAGRFQIGFEF